MIETNTSTLLPSGKLCRIYSSYGAMEGVKVQIMSNMFVIDLRP